MKIRRIFLLVTVALLGASQLLAQTTAPEGRAVVPDGRITFAVASTPAPTFFDPAGTPVPTITGFAFVAPYEDLKLKPR